MLFAVPSLDEQSEEQSTLKVPVMTMQLCRLANGVVVVAVVDIVVALSRMACRSLLNIEKRGSQKAMLLSVMCHKQDSCARWLAFSDGASISS